MYFFTDPASLPVQTGGQAFGPDVTNPATKYNLTSRLQLTASSKAFACQDAHMIIVESSDPDLVNVILKPIESLTIAFTPVLYYIFRGLDKGSFATGNAIRSRTSTSNSSFITNFWADFDSYKAASQQPNLPDPTLGSVMVLQGTANVGIDSVFLNQQQGSGYGGAFYVKEGEWIANFATTTIGVEVVTGLYGLKLDVTSSSYGVPLDLAFMRKAEHHVDITGLAGLELDALRDSVLSFLDPAALFGLHWEEGVRAFNGTGSPASPLRGQALYDTIISRFFTANRIYLDVRSEQGLSYNFYKNYGVSSTPNISIAISSGASTPQTYQTNGWPVILIEQPASTSAAVGQISVQLRIDDNTEPVVYREYSKYAGGAKSDDGFIKSEDLRGSTMSTTWTIPLVFQLPVATVPQGAITQGICLKLHYYRRNLNSNPVARVLKKVTLRDNLFGPLDLPYLCDPGHPFQRTVSTEPVLVSTAGFGADNFHLAENGAHFDNDKVVFYSKELKRPVLSGNTPAYVPGKTGTDSGIQFSGPGAKTSFMRTDVEVTPLKHSTTLGGGSPQVVGVLNIGSYTGSPLYVNSLFLLGLTVDELQRLLAAPGLSSNHPKYIVFDDLGTETNDGIYTKYTLRVQGLDSSGARAFAAPTQPVNVFANEGFFFASPSFAATQIPSVTSLVYALNYEERVGFTHTNADTGKLYGDEILELDPGMKTEVDGFIAALNAVSSTTVSAYLDIKTIIEDSAADIFLRAATQVKIQQGSSYVNPDDRPLYWARMKMEIALKQHPYFAKDLVLIGGKSNSKIKRGSQLATMLKLFEEKSRNYTGLSFAAAPAGKKKVVVTGFDPFVLNNFELEYGTIYQSNPSGAVALVLDNKVIGSSYIRTCLFPVRFEDFGVFGEGVVEEYLRNLLPQVDFILTISQGRPGHYDIEQYATLTRGSFEDNMYFKNPNHSKALAMIGSAQSAPEWLETNLPFQPIPQFPEAARHYYYMDRFGGKHNENSPNPIVTPDGGEQIWEGSGGDYLSNEIFYRVARIRKSYNDAFRQANNTTIDKLKSGHIHVPDLNQSFGVDTTRPEDDFSKSKTAQLIANVERIISTITN